jgi:hypothetical protein
MGATTSIWEVVVDAYPLCLGTTERLGGPQFSIAPKTGEAALAIGEGNGRNLMVFEFMGAIAANAGR